MSEIPETNSSALNSPKPNSAIMGTIAVLSVAVPVLVAILLFKKGAIGDLSLDVTFLPHLNAMMNTATAVCLIVGFIMIKKKNIAYHRLMMMTAFVLSSIFLISYVIYHSQAESTSFGGEGVIRYVYFFILISHILLSMTVVPLALLAIYFGISKQISRHKKIVKWTFPVWTYVAVTGVLVYIMIRPYYG